MVLFLVKHLSVCFAFSWLSCYNNFVESYHEYIEYSATYTVNKVLPEFTAGSSWAPTRRMCGMSCLQKTFCKTFNYHVKDLSCEYLVTDSRLIGRENELGYRPFISVSHV